MTELESLRAVPTWWRRATLLAVTLLFGGAAIWVLVESYETFRGQRTLTDTSAWRGLEECRTQLDRLRTDGPNAGVTASSRGKAQSLRIATWNVRYFPDGIESNLALPWKRTPVEWLACTLATLDADIIALQEFKQHERARDAVAELRAAVQSLTGRRYEFVASTCGDPNLEHTAFLYDRARVDGTSFEEVFLGKPGHCAGGGPALMGRFRIRGADSDLTLLNVHFPASDSRASFEARRRAAEKLRRTATAAVSGTGAPGPWIALGDFNMSGCAECGGHVSGAAERERLTRELAGAGLQLLPVRPACSGFWSRTAELLDGIAVGVPLARRGTAVQAAGLCAELDCKALDGRPLAYDRISDHCPLAVDIELYP